MDSDKPKQHDTQNIEMFDSSPDLLFRFDSEGIFLEYYANEELLYTEPQNFLGKQLDQSLPGDVAQAGMAAIKKALSTHRPQTFNYQIIVMGALRSYEARVIPAGNDEVLAHIHDTTEQLLAERLLRCQKELMEGFSTAPDLKTMLSLCLDSALSLAKLDCGTIYLVDEKLRSIDLICHQGFSDEFTKKASHYEINSSQGQIIMAGKPFYIDYQVLASQLNSNNEEHLRGSAIIPVKSDKGIVAAFLVSSRSFEVIPALSRQALETIASFIGGALERSRNQHELLQNQKQLKALFDSIQDCMIVLDIDGVIISANPVVSSRLGYAEHELTGMPLVKIYPEELHGKIRAVLKRAFTGEHVSCVIPVITTENIRIPMETRFYTTEWDDRQIFIAISRDISKLVEITNLLNYEKSFTDTAIDVQSDMFLCIELPSGKMLRWNKAFRDITGYTDDEIILMSTLESYFSKSDIQRGIIFFEELIQKNTGAIEVELLCINGRKVLVEFRVALIKNQQGQPTFLVAVGRDISQRKAIEEHLKKSEMFLKEAQRLGDMGHWCYNVQDGTIEWSDELFHLFGAKKGEFEMNMENIDKMIHPEDLSGYVKCREQIALNHDNMEYECRIVRSDNEIRFVISRIKLIKGESGDVVYILGTFQDVTERKRMKEALFNSQRLESLGIMAAGIAHDFNNLLCGIFGNIEIMKQFLNGDERINSYFDRISKGYLRARDLTTQLQTFSKGSPLCISAVNVNEILSEACSLALSGSTIACEMNLDASMPATTADANQLSQVFNNVLINARQAMISGGNITIQTKCRNIKAGEIHEMGSGNYIEITIQDNGIGIPQENLKKVFDPFFTTKQSGSGLGLAISYSIIKKHSGKILIDSEKGKGTTIIILLPVIEIKVRESDNCDVHGEKLNGRILLLDNEEIARVVAEEMLQFIGLDVVSASDGREALDLFHREKQAGNPFDLLLLDLTIPGGFGGELVMNEIRKVDPGIPGIITSGYLDNPVLDNPQSYGFSAKVDKPYQLDELWRTIGKVLKKTVRADKIFDTHSNH
jgi:PAS domain S-box-containing protein